MPARYELTRCKNKEASPTDQGRLLSRWCFNRSPGSEGYQQSDETDTKDASDRDLIFDLLHMCRLQIGQNLLNLLRRRFWVNVKMNHVHGIWFGNKMGLQLLPDAYMGIHPGQQYKYIVYRY